MIWTMWMVRIRNLIKKNISSTPNYLPTDDKLVIRSSDIEIICSWCKRYQLIQWNICNCLLSKVRWYNICMCDQKACWMPIMWEKVNYRGMLKTIIRKWVSSQIWSAVPLKCPIWYFIANTLLESIYCDSWWIVSLSHALWWITVLLQLLSRDEGNKGTCMIFNHECQWREKSSDDV